MNPNDALQGRALICLKGITLACALFAEKRLIFTDGLGEATPAATVRVAMIRDLNLPLCLGRNIILIIIERLL